MPLTYAMLDRRTMSARDARAAITDLADVFSWETIAREMISQMSGDDARDFLEDFLLSYAD